jgi:polyhydroxyalkanoate synthesis regulator phasin
MGHREALKEHEEKIAQEMKKANPDHELIELWKKHIRNIRNQIEKLERRLTR